MTRTPIACLSILAGVALIGCASPSNASYGRGASSAVSGSTSPESVQEAFVSAVMDICVPMFPEIGDLKDIAAASGIHLDRLKVGSQFRGGIVTAMPVYRSDDGITHIRQNLIAGACEVFSYGPQVEDTFNRTSAALTKDGEGFSEVPNVGDDLPEKMFLRVFEKPEDGIVYQVVLSGNEPGAPGTMSRFSTLRATVSFKKAD